MVKKAKWVRSWYFRKRSKTWRQRGTGLVSRKPKGRIIAREDRLATPYGSDLSSRRKSEQAKVLFKDYIKRQSGALHPEDKRRRTL